MVNAGEVMRRVHRLPIVCVWRLVNDGRGRGEEHRLGLHKEVNKSE